MLITPERFSPTTAIKRTKLAAIPMAVVVAKAVVLDRQRLLIPSETR
jgi:hypothetical protein